MMDENSPTSGGGNLILNTSRPHSLRKSVDSRRTDDSVRRRSKTRAHNISSHSLLNMKIEHGETADNIISNEDIPKIPEIQDLSNIQALPDGNTSIKVVKHLSKPIDENIVVNLNSAKKQ